MKLRSLEITRKYSYNDSECTPLIAKCTLSSDGTDNGDKMSVNLSPEAIAKIINVIAGEVQRKASEAVKSITGGLKADSVGAIENGAASRITNVGTSSDDS